jgi:hypothetical protein
MDEAASDNSPRKILDVNGLVYWSILSLLVIQIMCTAFLSKQVRDINDQKTECLLHLSQLTGLENEKKTLNNMFLVIVTNAGLFNDSNEAGIRVDVKPITNSIIEAICNLEGATDVQMRKIFALSGKNNSCDTITVSERRAVATSILEYFSIVSSIFIGWLLSRRLPRLFRDLG